MVLIFARKVNEFQLTFHTNSPIVKNSNYCVYYNNKRTHRKESFMEIERKFTIKELPDLSSFPSKKIVQAYLNTDPVIRIRREENNYYLTYKGKGLLSREEYNLPLNQESFDHLLPKADGIVISKTRYCIPFEKYVIELDVFEDALAPLIMAEVEFESEEEAHAFIPPAWFLEDVTNDKRYHNSNMSKGITPLA